MNKDTFNWVGGLVSAATGAASGALSGALGPMVADPADFNFGAGFHKVIFAAAIVSVIMTAVAILNYLAKSPLPGWPPAKDQQPKP